MKSFLSIVALLVAVLFFIFRCAGDESTRSHASGDTEKITSELIPNADVNHHKPGAKTLFTKELSPATTKKPVGTTASTTHETHTPASTKTVVSEAVVHENTPKTELVTAVTPHTPPTDVVHPTPVSTTKVATKVEDIPEAQMSKVTVSSEPLPATQTPQAHSHTTIWKDREARRLQRQKERETRQKERDAQLAEIAKNREIEREKRKTSKVKQAAAVAAAASAAVLLKHQQEQAQEKEHAFLLQQREANRLARDEARRVEREKREHERLEREKAHALEQAKIAQARKAQIQEREAQRAAQEAQKLAKEKAAALQAQHIADEKAQLEAKRLAEKEAARIAHEKFHADRDAKLKATRIAEEKAALEAKRVADEKAKAEMEAKRVADEKAKAELEAKRIAEEKAKAELETKRVADEKAKAELEAKRIAEEKAKAEKIRLAAEALLLKEAESKKRTLAQDKQKLFDSFSLTKITFKHNKAELTDESKTILNETAHLMSAHPNFHYNIQGHTDATGKESYNVQLSEARAQSVMKYLNEKGVDDKLLSAKGFGSSMPIADNKTKEGRLENRRVVFKIIE